MVRFVWLSILFTLVETSAGWGGTLRTSLRLEICGTAQPNLIADQSSVVCKCDEPTRNSTSYGRWHSRIRGFDGIPARVAPWWTQCDSLGSSPDRPEFVEPNWRNPE
jgi:hypothetical protein